MSDYATRKYIPAGWYERRRQIIERLKTENRRLREYARAVESLNYHPNQCPNALRRVARAKAAL